MQATNAHKTPPREGGMRSPRTARYLERENDLEGILNSVEEAVKTIDYKKSKISITGNGRSSSPPTGRCWRLIRRPLSPSQSELHHVTAAGINMIGPKQPPANSWRNQEPEAQ